jgi:hypothetical protein
MAIAVQASLIGTERVVDRALAIYRAHLEQAIEVPLGDMAAGESRVAEIMVDETVVCEQIIPAIWSLADQGWTATVVMPAERMGEAHFAMRGLPCRLQAWWEDGTVICFGSYETP